MDGDLAQHGVVLELRLAERGRVASDDDELGLAGTQALQSRLVTESDLARLHDQRQARGQGVGLLLRLFKLSALRPDVAGRPPSRLGGGQRRTFLETILTAVSWRRGLCRVG